MQEMYRSKEEMSVEDLRSVTTVEEFDNIVASPEIDIATLYVHIRSPVILRHYLTKYRDKIDLIEAFFVVYRERRVDLLECFFPPLTIRELIEKCYPRLWNCLFDSVRGGFVDLTTFFLDKGYDVNLEVEKDIALFYLPLLPTACLYGKIDIVDLLLTRNADVNVDHCEETPVFFAARCNDVRILDRLIMHGANLDHRDSRGNNLWSKLAFSPYTKEREVIYRRLVEFKIVPVYHHEGKLLNEEEFIEKAIGFSFYGMKNDDDAKGRIKRLLSAAFRGEQCDMSTE